MVTEQEHDRRAALLAAGDAIRQAQRSLDAALETDEQTYPQRARTQEAQRALDVAWRQIRAASPIPTRIPGGQVPLDRIASRWPSQTADGAQRRWADEHEEGISPTPASVAVERAQSAWERGDDDVASWWAGYALTARQIERWHPLSTS